MKVIITTTINAPAAAIRKYDAMPDWHLLVVGDRKTPEYKLERGFYLSWEYQQETYPELCTLIGPDNTQRGRMIAMIEAHKRGAELVATIDDDCDPIQGWPGPIYVGQKDLLFDCYDCKDIVFDPITTAGYKHPARGYPPQLRPGIYRKSREPISPLVQENFWNGEADYDACWRVHGTEFETCSPCEPFWTKRFSPFNTQNTIIHGSVLKDYCGEIPFVGHVGDIWAGYLFEVYHPGSVLYCPATVIHHQNRTLRSVLKDLKQEMKSYKSGLKYVKALKRHGSDGIMKALPKKAIEAINIYRRYFE